MARRLLEICVDSLASAIAAEEGGANRIELCENLAQGGVTPSAGKIRLAKKMLDIPVFVLIRPRKADFLYSALEFELMLEEIKSAKALGADGIVSGVLHPDGSIDQSRTEKLVEAAWPLPFTFHRAFDMCRDPLIAAEQIADLGVRRILTSGQKNRVAEGYQLIRRLLELVGDRMLILAGGGLQPETLEPLLSLAGLREFHASARHQVGSRMAFLGNTTMGSESLHEEFRWDEVDVGLVRRLRRKLDR